MKTYILLFRGINVGGKNGLLMKDLKALLEGEGCMNVKTYIQSGNVVLQSATKPTDSIAHAIEAKFGFRPAVVVLEVSALLNAVKRNPFEPIDGKGVHYYFPLTKFAPDVDRLEGLAAATEKYAVIDDVFYLYAPDGIGRSKLVAKIGTCLGVPVTGRNSNTINKLLAMSIT